MRIIFIVFVTDSKNENQFVRSSTDFQKLPIYISPTFLHSSPSPPPKTKQAVSEHSNRESRYSLFVAPAARIELTTNP